ncbi:hypothetical protein FNV43_RR18033 [Rhamnella rubrinervis]|uniref:Tac7077 n=1 Tax=Rhamnella rubrinervis TaxID=2594499 RepID=A0A8K0E5G1_9ROSA|nr:hypothetical protein FNV43_RR18033 [Rhamnella rubrinervis]
MFLSKKQGKSLRFFFLFRHSHSSQFPQHKQHHYHFAHNHSHRFLFLRNMAAAAAANGIRSDLFFCRGFHVRYPSDNTEFFSYFPFHGKHSVSTRSYRASIDSAGYGGCGCGGCSFTVRGCFDSQHHEYRGRSLHSHSKTNNRSVRGNEFEYHKAQLVSDLELEGSKLLANNHNNLEGTYQRGNPLGFPHHPLPHDKIVVAVDVDEVLGNFLSALNRFIADRYSSFHSVSEYHVYEFFKIWNCSRDEAAMRVHEFFKTSYFKTGIHPIPGSQQALDKLSRFCSLSVVTSRQNAIKDHTIEWIEKHYPGMFEEIHFGNHFALNGESKPKSEICRSLGAKVLIDDNPRYALECAEAGMRVLLFDYENSYPWCKIESIDQHPLVTKVHNWEEVERQLITLAFH